MAFDLSSQYDPALGGGGQQPMGGVAAPPSTLEALMQLIMPYLQSVQGQRTQGMNSLVRGLQTLRGGGVRDFFTGGIRNPDPLVAQQEHDAYWNNMFSSPTDRIAKERQRFQTPMDIPTFTEQELAGINARARGKTQPRQMASQAAAPMASPAPTPNVARNAGPPMGPQEKGGAGTPPAGLPPNANLPYNMPNLKPAMVSLPPNPLDALFATGMPITPQVGQSQFNYGGTTPPAPAPTFPWRYGTGTLGPGGEQPPQVPNFMVANPAPIPPQPSQIPPWMYGVGTMR